MSAKPSQSRSYEEIVRIFVASGAALIRQTAAVRYRGLVAEGTRLLEPGFIPPDSPARVLIVSYFPNATDLDGPGTPAYDELRAHFEAWADSEAVEDYRLCHEDWQSNLDRIPFHRKRTRPILEAVGLSNRDIAWLPFVKVPLPAGSSPGDEIMDVDIDVLWEQLQLLRPRIVWIQGVGIRARIEGLVKDRITDMILPAQSVSQYDSPAKQKSEHERISKRLREYLASA